MVYKKSSKIIFLEKALRVMAVLVLKKYQPQIIGITGSVGKTSAKEAIFAVVSAKFKTRKTEKNYNNEIGVPLTIIGSQGGENSLWRWNVVFWKWMKMIIFKIDYPEILVLEMGADKPGDIKYLAEFIKLKAGVITDFSSSHIEFFKNIEGVAREKSILVKKIEESGWAILNADNAQVAKLENQVRCNVITFGFSEEAQMRATDCSFSFNQNNQEIKGLSFKLNYKGTTLPVRLNNILARHQVRAALAGAAVGVSLGINLVDAGVALENFSSPPGRMNIISGINKATIIDDTYNSSPVSAFAALDTLFEMASLAESKRRMIVVLGDMLELGEEEEKRHREIVEKIEKNGVAVFVAVGKRMCAAIKAGMGKEFSAEKTFCFSGPEEAGKRVAEIIKPGDYVLVKGSQGMRMEKVVEKIMQNPEKSEDLLCRQNKSWKNRAWKEV